jgi:hypothetical protein
MNPPAGGGPAADRRPRSPAAGYAGRYVALDNSAEPDVEHGSKSAPRSKSSSFRVQTHVTPHVGRTMLTGHLRSVTGSMGWCFSHAVRSICGRGAVDTRRQNRRRRMVIHLARGSWPVRRVPRHTIQTGTSSRVGLEPSASIAATPLLVELDRPERCRHLWGHTVRSAGVQVSRGNKERQHNIALQRTHSRVTPLAERSNRCAARRAAERGR